MSLDRIDKSSMVSMVNGFPIMLRATSPEPEIINMAKQDFDGVCLIGMGGSAIAGELCKGLYNDISEIPIVCVKDYFLPRFVNSNWSIIAVSYSGNTEETLSAFNEAKQRGCTTFTITSGGQLKNLADSKRRSAVPPEFQPRAALPLLLSLELPIIEAMIKTNLSNLSEISRNLESKAKKWETLDIAPQFIAEKLKGKIPLFIGSGHLEAVAYRAKCQFNENAKIASFYSVLPESNHNEIESAGWFGPKEILPVFLRSHYETQRIRKRIKATSDIFEDEGASCIHLQHDKTSKLEELLSHVFSLDIVSIKIATLLDVDPVAVDRISRLKKMLSED